MYSPCDGDEKRVIALDRGEGPCAVSDALPVQLHSAREPDGQFIAKSRVGLGAVALKHERRLYHAQIEM